jgi:hypothetical protein
VNWGHPCAQGEVEQISMMRPMAQGPHDTGLLEYLEDIIGTDAYKPRIEEASKQCVHCPACRAPCPCGMQRRAMRLACNGAAGHMPHLQGPLNCLIS